MFYFNQKDIKDEATKYLENLQIIKKDIENFTPAAKVVEAPKTESTKPAINFVASGEENSEKCGVCDVCVLEKRKNIKDKEFLRISNKIKEYLQEKEHSLEEICTLLPNTNEQEIINILNFLFDNDKIGKYGNKYQWKG